MEIGEVGQFQSQAWSRTKDPEVKRKGNRFVWLRFKPSSLKQASRSSVPGLRLCAMANSSQDNSLRDKSHANIEETASRIMKERMPKEGQNEIIII